MDVYTYADQEGRVADWSIAVKNVGHKTAKNILIIYDTDFFTLGSCPNI